MKEELIEKYHKVSALLNKDTDLTIPEACKKNQMSTGTYYAVRKHLGNSGERLNRKNVNRVTEIPFLPKAHTGESQGGLKISGDGKQLADFLTQLARNFQQ